MKISLNIDGKKVQVRKGMTVLEAARKEGITIPTLCDHPQIESSGSCRLCIVEIDGMNGYLTACTTPVAEGMVVRTDTPSLRSLRRNILELILSEHPYTCLVCDKRSGCEDYQGTIRKVGVTTGCQTCPKNGACELQNLARDLGLEEMAFPIAYRKLPVEQEDPFFDRDYNLCVLCGRCVRMCNGVRYNGTLTFGFRGEKTVVGTAFGKSHMESGCEFCGACVDVCPTGALFDKRSKWEGCPDRSVPSLCPYCSVGCSLSFNLKHDTVVSTTPYLDGTLNQGQICVRGRFGVVDSIRHPKRLQKPMIKKEGRWIEVSWGDAFRVVAEKFSKYSGEQFGLVVSDQCTNEDAYAMQKFARAVMKSRRIYASFCSDALIELLQKIQTQELPAATLEDIRKAEALVIWGADISVSHPIAALSVKQRHREGAKLIVVDPRKTKLAGEADLHIPLKAGTDGVLISSLLQWLKDQNLVQDKNLTGWETVGKVDLSSLKKAAGISDRHIETLASLLTRGNSVVFLLGSGVFSSRSGREAVRGLYNLALAFEKSKVLPVVGETNTLGCAEMGCCPEILPGLVSAGDETARRKFEKLWGTSLTSRAEIQRVASNAKNEPIRCLYMAGELPEMPWFEKVEFLVVQSVFPPLWMDRADVVLPAAHLSEVEGTVTNFERRIQRLRRVLRSTGESKPDWWICSQIAERMKAPGFAYRKFSDVFREITAAVPEYHGLTIGRLGKRGVHRDRLKKPLKKIKRSFAPFHVEEKMRVPSKAYPFTLLVGSNITGYRNGSLAVGVPSMKRIMEYEGIQIHPQDAAAVGIQNKERIRILSKEGLDFTAIALITEKVPTRTLYINNASDIGYGRLHENGHPHFVKIEKGAYE